MFLCLLLFYRFESFDVSFKETQRRVEKPYLTFSLVAYIVAISASTRSAVSKLQRSLEQRCCELAAVADDADPLIVSS